MANYIELESTIQYTIIFFNVKSLIMLKTLFTIDSNLVISAIKHSGIHKRQVSSFLYRSCKELRHHNISLFVSSQVLPNFAKVAHLE